jgi:hypothetical protein
MGHMGQIPTGNCFLFFFSAHHHFADMVGNTMQVDGHDDHIVHASNKGAREMQNQ